MKKLLTAIKNGLSFNSLTRLVNWDEFRQYLDIAAVVEEEWTPQTSKPLSLHIGYFPDISKHDLTVYLQAIAENNHVSTELSFVGIIPFLKGYAYELHEGGPGLAFLPSIIANFDESADLSPDDPVVFYLNTAQRTVLVEVHSGGLSAFLLPETQHQPQSEEIVGGTVLSKMRLNNSLRVHQASRLVCSVSVFLLMLSILFRPSVPANPVVNREAFAQLPVAQWQKLNAVQRTGVPATLRYSEAEGWTVTGSAAAKGESHE